MRRLAWLGLWSVCAAAQAAVPPNLADFQGSWRVARMVGASDVGTKDDFRKLLGTRVEWSADAVEDADGTCRIVHPAVSFLTTDALQHDLWGGQTVAGLDLPKTEIAKTFGTTTPVFDDGGKGCARAIMLSPNRLLLMFANGYLYLLERSL